MGRVRKNSKKSNNFLNRFHYFVNNNHIHGLRFLGRHYGTLDRTYWGCILIASLISMIVTFVYTLYGYMESPILINFDANFSNKDSIFPAVSICFDKQNNNRASVEHLKKFVQNYYAEHKIEEPQIEDFYEQLLDYAYHNPGDVTNIKYLDACDAINSSCGMNIETIKPLLFPYCDELFDNIQFNGKRYYNCNDIFKRMISYGEGICFIANSVYFYDSNWGDLPMTYNRNQPSSKFTFDLIQRKGHNFLIFLHSPNEFPITYNSWSFNLYDDYNQDIAIRTTQLVNTDDVRDVSIEKRQCRFPDERWPAQNASLPYSFVSCLIYRRVEIDLKLCNCTLHFAPIEYKNQYCNHTQMKCIAERETRSLARDHHENIESCLSTCTEMHVGLVGYYRKRKAQSYKSVNESDPISGITTLTIDIHSQPRQLTRSVRFTRLDLVVTIGSIIGLFFGASVLSLVEIVHIWILSRFPCFSNAIVN